MSTVPPSVSRGRGDGGVRDVDAEGAHLRRRRIVERVERFALVSGKAAGEPFEGFERIDVEACAVRVSVSDQSFGADAADDDGVREATPLADEEDGAVGAEEVFDVRGGPLANGERVGDAVEAGEVAELAEPGGGVGDAVLEPLFTVDGLRRGATVGPGVEVGWGGVDASGEGTVGAEPRVMAGEAGAEGVRVRVMAAVVIEDHGHGEPPAGVGGGLEAGADGEFDGHQVIDGRRVRPRFRASLRAGSGDSLVNFRATEGVNQSQPC